MVALYSESSCDGLLNNSTSLQMYNVNGNMAKNRKSNELQLTVVNCNGVSWVSTRTFILGMVGAGDERGWGGWVGGGGGISFP